MAIFDIEFTRRCNISCRFCPRSSMKSPGDMSAETFEHLLLKIPAGRSHSLSLCGLGEPLLHPHFRDYLARLSDAFPASCLNLVTNGTLLDEQTVSALLSARVFSISVSFNGIDAHTYEDWMKGAHFEKTLSNLEYARREIERAKAPTRLTVNFILTRENLPDKEKIESFWASRGIVAASQYMHDRGGFVSQRDMSPVDPRQGVPAQGCGVFRYFHFIAFNGDVLYCCHDVAHGHVLGNIARDDGRAIQTRKEAVMRDRNWPDMCRTCTDVNRHIKFQ